MNNSLFVNPQAPIYKFQEYETPTTGPLNDLETVGGDDAPNLYGRVVGKKGNLRLRRTGNLLSLWAGPKLVLTKLIN